MTNSGQERSKERIKESDQLRRRRLEGTNIEG